MFTATLYSPCQNLQDTKNKNVFMNKNNHKQSRVLLDDAGVDVLFQKVIDGCVEEFQGVHQREGLVQETKVL